MSTTDYLINIALVLLVLVQIRDRKLDLRSLLLPVIAVVGCAVYYLHGVPTAGNDVVLDVVLGAGGMMLGIACGWTTRVWRGADDVAHSRAGVVAAILWIVGIGSRLAFELYSTHGGSHSIIRFSIDHRITGSNAWVAALIVMALAEVVARLVVLRIRASRPTCETVSPAAMVSVTAEASA